MTEETIAEYTFEVSERLSRDYKYASSILAWLTENLESLTDDEDKKIFGKVNTGFNEETIKTFGKTPVCDIYINNSEFSSDFDEHKPQEVHTVLIFYVKGANNPTYIKACELYDYVMQQFIAEESFRMLEDVVMDTYITDGEIQPRPIGKKWGVMGVLELSHILY